MKVYSVVCDQFPWFLMMKLFICNQQSKVQAEDVTNADASIADTPKLPKNDAVNRFWVSVEPYCAPITSDDLRVIEEMLKSYDEETEYMKIPALGVHFTQRWAEEDLLEEHTDGKESRQSVRYTVECN